MEAGTLPRPSTTATEITPERPEGAADDTGAVEETTELAIDLGGQLSFTVGGKKVTSSSLRLVGGKVDLEGELRKGETAVLRLEVAVTEIAFIDQRDPKTQQITGCERRHKARITGISLEDA